MPIMNQLERDVYDNYPSLMRALIQTSAAFAKMPLEQMLGALDKIRFTQAYIGPRGTESVDPDRILEHRDLIVAAIAFRDEYIELAMQAARRDDTD